MSVTALRELIRRAEGFESFADRVERRNAVLLAAYNLLAPLDHWPRCSALANEIARFRPTWRRCQYDAEPPVGCSAVQALIFRAGKTTGRLPPATAHGIDAALKSTNRSFKSRAD